MIKSFKYRVYPKRSQLTAIKTAGEVCVQAYNYLMDFCKFRSDRRMPSYFDLANELAKAKKERPNWSKCNAQVLQQIAWRVAHSFQDMVSRKGNFKQLFKERKYLRSFVYPQIGHGCSIKAEGIYLNKIGLLKIKMHRPLEGTPKRIQLIVEKTDKVFIVVQCEVEPLADPLKGALNLALVVDAKCSIWLVKGTATGHFFRFKFSPSALRRKYLRTTLRKRATTMQKWEDSTFEQLWDLLPKLDAFKFATIGLALDPLRRGPGGYPPRFITRLLNYIKAFAENNGREITKLTLKKEDFDNPFESSIIKEFVGRHEPVTAEIKGKRHN